MSSTTKQRERNVKDLHHEQKREEKHHEKAVEDSFPASDPPATSQPGSGITGAEVVSDKKNKNKR